MKNYASSIISFLTLALIASSSALQADNKSVATALITNAFNHFMPSAKLVKLVADEASRSVVYCEGLDIVGQVNYTLDGTEFTERYVVRCYKERLDKGWSARLILWVTSKVGRDLWLKQFAQHGVGITRARCEGQDNGSPIFCDDTIEFPFIAAFH